MGVCLSLKLAAIGNRSTPMPTSKHIANRSSRPRRPRDIYERVKLIADIATAPSGGQRNRR